QTENEESAHTTRLKKCKGCQINEGSDSDKLQCTLRRQLRSKKRALQSNWVKKGKEVGEFFLEIPLESLGGKRNKVQITGDRSHIDGQHLSAIEIATREEELISIHLEELQAAGSRPCLEMEKKQQSQNLVAGWETGHLPPGAIWTTLLVTPEKACVTIYTDSKEAIKNIHKARLMQKMRETLKSKNASLLLQIRAAIEAKESKLNLRKIKSHMLEQPVIHTKCAKAKEKLGIQREHMQSLSERKRNTGSPHGIPLVGSDLVQKNLFGVTKQEKTLVRLEIIRGVISLKRARKVADLTGKKKRAKKVIQDLVNLAQSRFIEHTWKFRCELTAEWEEKEGITKDNKHKPKEAEKKAETDPVRKKRKGKEK
ncbi:1411_t:CDS:2, partial [Gigaspora rosea]